MADYDMHPFQRPWKDQARPLEMAQPYTAAGRFEDSVGAHPCFQFHWRIGDLLNPLADGGGAKTLRGSVSNAV